MLFGVREMDIMEMVTPKANKRAVETPGGLSHGKTQTSYTFNNQSHYKQLQMFHKDFTGSSLDWWSVQLPNWDQLINFKRGTVWDILRPFKISET